MAAETTSLPKLTAEQRRAAAGQFERANQVIKAGDMDYGLQLLLNCCKIDPASLTFRQTLRQSQRAKYGNSGKGQALAYVRSMWGRLRLQRLMLVGNYADALVQAELIFMRNPWDLGTHIVMAQAFEGLELPDNALWTLEQVRPVHPKNPKVNRPLARLYEKRGNFNQAIALWELVRAAQPDDLEAASKGKDLAASATIAKGRYEDALKGAAPSPLVREEASKETAEHQVTDARTEAAVAIAEDRNPREVANLLEKIKQNPRNANAYLQLARVYRKAEQPDKATALLREALGPTGNSFEITQELFDLEIEPMRQDLAIAEERLRGKPSDKELAQLRDRLAREVSARELEYHRRRSERNPTDSSARFEVALRLMRVGQSDEAIKELQTIRNDPRFHGKALFYLGLCFQSRKNWRLAQRNLEDALKQLGVGDGELRKETMYLLAQGYAETGELTRAVDIGCELANLDFNYKNIGGLLDDWQAKVVK